MKLNRDEMIGKRIDIHMHHGIMLSSLFDDKTPFCQNMSGIIDSLKECDLDYGVVFPFPNNFIGNDILSDQRQNECVRNIFEKTPYLIQNMRLIDEAGKLAKNRVLPVPMFSIKYCVDEQLSFLNEQVKNGAVYGLKFYPEADGVPIRELRNAGTPFLGFLSENNLPLFIHVSAESVVANSLLSRPEDAYMLAADYPKLRVCIAHMGHFSKVLFSWLKENTLKNCYMDTSPFLHICNVRKLSPSENCFAFDYESPSDVLSQLIDMFPNNIVWGSDNPFNFTCNLHNENHDKNIDKHSILEYSRLLHSLPVGQLQQITSVNSLNLLFGEK